MIKYKAIRLLLILIAPVLLVSCVNSDDSGPDVQGIYVLNEGNFTKGNASITEYNPNNGDVEQQAFQNKNGFPLGDVGNSMTGIGDRLFIVVNNSDKVEVVERSTLTSIGTVKLSDGSGPRYVARAGVNKAYVTNLYGNNIDIIDLQTLSVKDSIAVGPNPEGIALVGQTAYVANSGLGSGSTVSVIDTQQDKVTATIEVHDNPTVVKADGEGRVWVVCTGAYGAYDNPDDDTPGYVVVLDGTDGTVLKEIKVGGHPTDLVVQNQLGKAFLLNGPVQVISTTKLEVTDESFITPSYYALGIHSGEEPKIYTADPLNYAQAGKAFIYNLDGAKVDSFKTGIIPGAFYFVE